MNTYNQKNAQSPEVDLRTQSITLRDFEKFKAELISEVIKMVGAGAKIKNRKWLKSYEVKELLGISSGKLQNLRLNGTLPFTKIGGVLLYDQDDIEKMDDKNRAQADFVIVVPTSMTRTY